MEQLILSMLKITRLDTGNILFDKRACSVQELIKNAISELTTRATQEKKQLIVQGTPNQTVICDMDWTSEAIGNLDKKCVRPHRSRRSNRDYLGKYANYVKDFSLR